MAHADVYAAVSSVVPCRHLAWGDEKPPALPWAVFYGEETPALFADDEQQASSIEWTVELYEKRRDKALEKRLDEAIRAKFGSFTKRETWVSSESCELVTYDFTEYEGVNNG